MIENIDYIYLAMYALDLYDGLTSLIILLLIISIIGWLISWIIPFCMESENQHPDWEWWKPWIKYLPILIFVFSSIMAIAPSKNTVKVFMGVKTHEVVKTIKN